MNNPRVTVEETLTAMCEFYPIPSRFHYTKSRLALRGRNSPPPYFNVFYVVQTRVWRAFYTRHPKTMHTAIRQNIRAMAREFLAHDQAAAAMEAINNVLQSASK